MRAAIDRAGIGGARLVGVAADGASFGFDDDAIEEAVDLALAYVHDASGGAQAASWKVGVGRGDLCAVADEGPMERLSVGPAMARAAAMARVARPGEVVIDLAVSQAAAGSLLAVGRRVGTDAGRRFRGIVLDLREPWRRDGSETMGRIRESRLVGRESALETLGAVGPGGLGVVRAAPGLGGSRLLDEIVARTARTLVIAPAGCGAEPLGSLRAAIARDLLREKIPSLGAREGELMRALQSAAGVDVDGASDLLFAWLTLTAAEGDRPLILVDDAAQVDRATLEAVGFAADASGAPFGVIVRLDAGEAIPQALAALVVEAEVSLKALLPHEATAMLQDACGGNDHVSPEVVRRWARISAGIPLAVIESLRHGLAVGELALRDGIIAPRAKGSGRGRTLSPHAWLTRRLAALAADRPIDSAVVTLTAIAGAGMERAWLDEATVDLALPSGAALQPVIDRLVREGLLHLHGTKLSPSSRTLRDAATMRCEEAERRKLHAALAGAVARIAHGLDLAEGAHHAALAGDHLGAAALAMRAAERAKRAGLETSSDQLRRFARAEGNDGAPMPTTPSPPPAQSHRSPSPPSEELLDSDLEELPPSVPVIAAARPSSPPSARHSVPPSTVRTPPPPNMQVGAPPPPPRASAQPVHIVDRSTLGVGHLTTGQIAALPSPFTARRAAEAEALRSLADETLHEVAIDSSIPFDPPPLFSSAAASVEQLAVAARAALIAKDYAALERSLTTLEQAGGSPAAIARVRGVAALARGDIAEGIRLVRRAQTTASNDDEIARGAAASAIALGVAGRREEALLEVLHALSTERRRKPPRIQGDAAVRRLLDRLLS